MKKQTRIFTDVTIPAFLQASNKGFTIIPKKNQAGQVEFIVEGRDIDGALTELYSNAPIGCLDFIKSLKGLRSSIFALKGERK
ncbi:MAG: hypothetical protein HZA16_02800 [Nitrospirae bacterium]|nr:hypothetical protein [Nitrospirota bacterium]